MVEMYPHKISHPSGWPRISDLPQDEQKEFDQWLYGQTRPYIEGEADQNFFYVWDYLTWKGLRGRKETAWEWD